MGLTQEQFEKKFKAGDEVEWGREWEPKRGKIVAIGGPEEMGAAFRQQPGKLVCDGFWVPLNLTFAVLVRVDRQGAKGNPLPPAYYKPWPGSLRKA